MLEKILRSGQSVFVGGSSNEPVGLLHALYQRGVPEDVTFVQFPLGGMNRQDFTSWNESANLVTFFMTSDLRGADEARLQYLPMQMRAVFDYLAHNIDVALIQVAKDAQGVVRLGPNVDFIDAVLAGAETVVAELNLGFVAPAGAPQVSLDRFDFVFESNRALTEMPGPKIDEAAQAIGELVAGEIRDGDCLQTGIGAIPAAILQRLKDKNDLGMHGGLIDDGGMTLIQQGNITGQRKAIDRGKHVTGMALGSQALFEWLADTPDVLFRGADHTHEVASIRQLDSFVSINSAVEIDLYGQINAEVAGGRQISGTGGSVDFMRAAKSSKGGRSIVALNATAKGGSVSRIVSKVEMVTALRTDVDMVVTEYGIARLKNLPNAARRDALIEIAAPQFRDQLRAEK
ncbi:MAG: acetyl-CoA hydrolase/transferase C-terminal domain-containing protein [Pseudomonadota bacterium]